MIFNPKGVINFAVYGSSAVSESKLNDQLFEQRNFGDETKKCSNEHVLSVNHPSPATFDKISLL